MFFAFPHGDDPMLDRNGKNGKADEDERVVVIVLMLVAGTRLPYQR